MNKKIIIYFLTFFFLFYQNSYANYLKEYVRWLKLNHKTQSQFLVSTEGPCAGCAEYPTRTMKCFEKGGKQKKMCITDEWDPKWNRFKWKPDLPLSKKLLKHKKNLGERFKWDSNPSLERLHYQTFHYLEDDKGWSKHEIIASENPYKFKFNLREDKDVDLQLQKSGLLSYLFFENGEITVDKKTPIERMGRLFNDETKWTSASMGKSIVSYVVGHAICGGYIDNIDVELSDWPLLSDTLYENVSLINLLNMAAGDQKLAKNNLKKGKGRERNPNVNTIEYHMNGIFRGTKPSKNKYNYSNLVSNILINYVWFKSNGDFQKITDKVFKEKAKIKNNVFFLKQNFRTVNNKYPVTDESGPLRYSFRADRYDYLRIAIAMMKDWQNDTCVGKYLKEVVDKKIPKNLENKNKTGAYSYSLYYGGQFHLDFPGFAKRNILGLDGAYGQAILIDMDKSKIVAINAVHTNYKWHKIALSALK